VYDDVAWIRDTSTFLRKVRETAVPCVGVCFGHQLLAHALGGRVEKAADGWGAGNHRVELSGLAKWKDGDKATCDLLFLHQDQVVALPEDGVVLGWTDHCPVAVMAIGESMLGVQAHPEIPPELIEVLVRDRVARIGAEKAAAALDTLTLRIESDLTARWLLQFMEGAALS
jgi:GMP synthase-like glutamine amidotransferase